MPASILWLVDDDSETGAFRQAFDEEGLTVSLTSPARLEERLRQGDFDVVLATLPLKSRAIEGLSQELTKAAKGLPVVLHDPNKTLPVNARWQGRIPNCQIVTTMLPDRLAELLAVVAVKEGERRREPPRVAPEPWRRSIVGESQPIRQMLEVIRLIACRRCTVLLTGETGTGKEVVARAIHMASDRAGSPMVAVNCAALPANLLEAELFGHTKGAFTGAVNPRVGRFEQAHRGTILLDEIGEMPPELQVKLLRVLQEREIQRIGSSETIQVDVRVIAATNTDLAEAVRQGTFRKDLFYRLNVVPLHVPPLRNRLEDVPLLADHFIEKTCRREGLPLKRVSADVITELSAHAWEGNVRELEHAVERAVVLSGERRILYAFDFGLVAETVAPCVVGSTVIRIPESGIDFEQTMVRIERALLEQALQKSSGNKARAAGMLGMKRTTLLSKIKAFGYCAA